MNLVPVSVSSEFWLKSDRTFTKISLERPLSYVGLARFALKEELEKKVKGIQKHKLPVIKIVVGM